MAWTIEYARSARKFIQKLDPQSRTRINSFLQERLLSLHDPRQVGDSLQRTRLGSYWRYRVGDYRIICELQDHRLVVLIVDIGHRRDVYRS